MQRRSFIQAVLGAVAGSVLGRLPELVGAQTLVPDMAVRIPVTIRGILSIGGKKGWKDALVTGMMPHPEHIPLNSCVQAEFLMDVRCFGSISFDAKKVLDEMFPMLSDNSVNYIELSEGGEIFRTWENIRCRTSGEMVQVFSYNPDHLMEYCDGD